MLLPLQLSSMARSNPLPLIAQAHELQVIDLELDRIGPSCLPGMRVSDERQAE
jgi:hypothetical protein